MVATAVGTVDFSFYVSIQTGSGAHQSSSTTCGVNHPHPSSAELEKE